jgi:hypothetical protein
MSIWSRLRPAMVLTVTLAGKTALACNTCGHAPCVMVPSPAPTFTCVTEMVPVTVMKTRTNVELVPVCTKTVTETKIDTVYDEQTQNVCKLVFDTAFEPHCTTVCRLAFETVMVCQSYTVCRPITTTRCVTEYRLQPYTELVRAPCGARCGHVGSPAGDSCNTIARTCYRRVPVVHEVTETQLKSEVRTQMVPTVRAHTVAEKTVEMVPVTTCRVESDVVRIKVPRLVFRTEPKTLVYKKAVLSCEEIPVTVYRPVVKMVPVVEPSPQALPTSQADASPSNQESEPDDE